VQDSGAQIKGSVVREFMLWYERTHGLEDLHERLAATPEEERRGLALDEPVLGIVANRWYPVEVVHLLCSARSSAVDSSTVSRWSVRSTRPMARELRD
jgi:hypothetical protein